MQVPELLSSGNTSADFGKVTPQPASGPVDVSFARGGCRMSRLWLKNIDRSYDG